MSLQYKVHLAREPKISLSRMQDEGVIKTIVYVIYIPLGDQKDADVVYRLKLKFKLLTQTEPVCKIVLNYIYLV